MPRRITRFEIKNNMVRTVDHSAIIHYRCDKCGETTKNYKDFTKHKREVHAY